ncbi:MAG TPA: ABC transporter ATP-binding protein [Dehalococcoidia bacterium]|nr:ABC transporter ATP-binding protein [Dehalococcoidia bacterium]
MQPKLELRDIAVVRAGSVVLDLDLLAVERGEVLAVVGPNGAGKTTLLQVAALLLAPTRGQVLIDGVAARPGDLALRRRVAVAMQDAMLVAGTVADNVALGLKLRGLPKAAREARARAWLRRFAIEELAGRRASRISGGEAQRASLARAFAIEPEVLFLDEPFGGLDEPTRLRLVDDLAAVVRETGVTTVFVTHDRDEALHLADRVAVILGGRLRQHGTPQEVFGAPVDEEVAAFIGVENILTGRLRSVEAGLAIVDVAGRTLAGVAPPDLTESVRVCLRPEAVTLQRGEGIAGGSARNALAGTVSQVRPRGAEARVVVDCGFPLVVLVTRLSAEDMGLAPGVPVVATFKATAVHLLPD